MRELDEKDKAILARTPKHMYSPVEEREFRRMRHMEEMKDKTSKDPIYPHQQKNK